MKTMSRLIQKAIFQALCLFALPVLAGTTNWSFNADLTLKESYDSNVYLQDVQPNRMLVPQAAEPFQESFVTSITPKLGLTWKPSTSFAANLAYTPEVVFYHSASDENYVAHRGQVNCNGTVAGVTWNVANALMLVDGSGEGLYFGGPGGAPAIGGIPIRDRRDQFVYRGKVSAMITRGKLFLRPVFSAYVHDFQTQQKAAATNPGYENYVDRSEVCVGADVGWQLTERTRVFVGYRYGKEIQGRLVGSTNHYDAVYDRPLAGIEGQPVEWLKVSFSVGPDIHHTTGVPAAGFERNYTTVWADGVVTFLLSGRDELALTWKQNTQPAFASCSVYDDITYDALFTHRFEKHWSASGGFRAYGGEWMAPTLRDDWIYTVSAKLVYVHDAHWSSELGYSYDWAESHVPNTAGREFTRHLGFLGIKYSF